MLRNPSHLLRRGLAWRVNFAFPLHSPHTQTAAGGRNRLRLLLPWLEARVAEGNQEPCVSSGEPKIEVLVSVYRV